MFFIKKYWINKIVGIFLCLLIIEGYSAELNEDKKVYEDYLEYRDGTKVRLIGMNANWFDYSIRDIKLRNRNKQSLMFDNDFWMDLNKYVRLDRNSYLRIMAHAEYGINSSENQQWMHALKNLVALTTVDSRKGLNEKLENLTGRECSEFDAKAEKVLKFDFDQDSLLRKYFKTVRISARVMAFVSFLDEKDQWGAYFDHVFSEMKADLYSNKNGGAKKNKLILVTTVPGIGNDLKKGSDLFRERTADALISSLLFKESVRRSADVTVVFSIVDEKTCKHSAKDFVELIKSAHEDLMASASGCYEKTLKEWREAEKRLWDE